jgi:hypothetical protein
VSETNIILKPSLVRAFTKVLLVILLSCVLGGIDDRYRHGHWWSIGYIESLGIPILLMPTLVCIGFVPRRIEYSESEFYLERRLRGVITLPWTDLYSYGTGNGVFLLRFENVNTLQIFAGAFERNEWKAFLKFLNENYPDRKASFWFGPNPIR